MLNQELGTHVTGHYFLVNAVVNGQTIAIGKNAVNHPYVGDRFIEIEGEIL